MNTRLQTIIEDGLAMIGVRLDREHAGVVTDHVDEQIGAELRAGTITFAGGTLTDDELIRIWQRDTRGREVDL